MHRLVRSIRCAGILAAACLTLLSGLALVWFFVQPETLPMLSTWQLAAILAAFVLPGLCLGAWQVDRQAVSAAAPRRQRREVTAPSVETPKPAKVQPVLPAAKPEPAFNCRRSPAGRTRRSERAIHRHRRSARV